tara:strand:- start:2098 stop:3735 length:1638 start_codon:yes stop_codon:yes gene_type:complete
LSKSTIADLQRTLDENIVGSLITLNISQTPSKLSDAIITCYGERVLYHKEIRKLLVNNLGNKGKYDLAKKMLTKKDFEELKTREGLIKKISSFTWGNNKKSKTFLKYFNLDLDLFIESKIQKTPERELIELEDKEDLKSWHFSLHEYQENLRKRIVINLLKKDKLLVHMPTGSGKTRVMMESICDFIRNQEGESTVVWMAYSDELCSQAADSFEERWQLRGTKPVNLIRFWGGRNVPQLDLETPNFVITSFDTAYSALRAKSNERFEFIASLRRKSNLCVVDEAHQAPAPTYKDAIKRITGRSKLVGLTATPGRGSDAEAQRVSGFFDGNKVSMEGKYAEPNPIAYLIKEKILSNIKYYSLTGSKVNVSPEEYKYIKDQLKIPDSIFKELEKDTKRNLTIIQEIIELVVENKQTIVFASSVKHAQLLTICLKTQGIKASCVDANTPYSERVDNINRFKTNDLNVLINFGVLTTGFDAPNTDAVVVARPTLSVVLFSQMVGRGLRGPKMGGTENCTIVNVVDNFSKLPNVEHAFTYFDKEWGEYVR